MPYDGLMEKYGFVPANHEKPVWFPVSIGQIYDAQGRAIPGHLRVQRDDTGDTLAVHSDKYRLIDYETSFRAFDEALLSSGLDCTGMMVATDMADNGARCFRQYVLPAYTEEIKAGDPVALRLVMFNSYDGSCSYRGAAGFYQFVCANTSILGKHIIDVKVRHSGEKPIEPVIESIVGAAAEHTRNIERARRWARIRIMAQDVTDLMKAMPQSTKPLVDQVTADFVRAGGETLWDLHSMLSHWATHGEAARGKTQRAKLSAERSQRILTLTEGVDWRKVETAAA